MTIIPSAALFLTTIIIVGLYCIALIISGDYGRSIGIFGSFEPKTTLHELLGTGIVFIVGSIFFGIHALIIGFLLGLLSIVVLKFEHFANYDANAG